MSLKRLLNSKTKFLNLHSSLVLTPRGYKLSQTHIIPNSSSRCNQNIGLCKIVLPQETFRKKAQNLTDNRTNRDLPVRYPKIPTRQTPFMSGSYKLKRAYPVKCCEKDRKEQNRLFHNLCLRLPFQVIIGFLRGVCNKIPGILGMVQFWVAASSAVPRLSLPKAWGWQNSQSGATIPIPRG